jgi:N-acyl-D-amino-acid deacylase
MFDILIKNGQVIDGSKAPGFRADVAIQGDGIARIGKLDGVDSVRVVDATGKIVAPGFIDIHSHGDMTLPACPTADSSVFQGVTTAVIGQCGLSPAPLFPQTRSEVITSLEPRKMPIPWEKWSNFKGYLDFLKDLGLSINILHLVGQGTIRAGIMRFISGRATPAQMESMRIETTRAIDAGAIGLSTGLVYPPGSYAPTEELIELTQAVGQRRGFYFSHIRGEDQVLLEAVAEAISIGHATGAAVQISHLKAGWPSNWAKQTRVMEMIDQARSGGLDVSADVYPYLAGATSLKSALPQWAQEGGKESVLKRLSEPGIRKKIIEAMGKEGFCRDGSWDRVRISRAANRQDYAGRFVAELAAEARRKPEEWVLDALLETELDIGMITFMISEDNLEIALKHPAVMIGSDSFIISTQGPLAQGVPHPRTFGTFPRVIAGYVRQKKILSLEEAIHKMTGLSAHKLRLADRGLIKEGYKADLVVFDPETIRDQATYENPFQYPAGIDHVFCNGVAVLKDEKHTGMRPGQIITSQ